MKKLALIMTVLPGSVLAHGGHPPVAAEVHHGLHVLPWLGIATIVVALVAAAVKGRGS